MQKTVDKTIRSYATVTSIQNIYAFLNAFPNCRHSRVDLLITLSLNYESWFEYNAAV